MLHKCVSSLFHLLEIYHWKQGCFIDLYNSMFQERQFPDGIIQNLWMVDVLACDHNMIPIDKHVL